MSQTLIKDLVKQLMAECKPSHTVNTDIGSDSILTDKSKEILNKLCGYKYIYTDYGCNFESLFAVVWAIIKDNSRANEFKSLLNKCLPYMEDASFCGQVNYLVCCLEGLDGINPYVDKFFEDADKSSKDRLDIYKIIMDTCKVENLPVYGSLKCKDQCIQELTKAGFTKDQFNEILDYCFESRF